MNYMQEFRINKKYSVPFHYINWSINKHTLDLEAIIDLEKYDNEDIIFPLKEWKCKDWCFKIGGDIYNFIASWDIRRVKDNLEIMERVNNNIKPFIVQRNI